jgi:signal transduction histidine kinase
MPLYNRSGLRLGVIQLLNKKDGVFTEEDETFLQTFGNNASVFIEMAQLQKARIDALEQSRKELEQLNKAKSRALDHLSHELRTPLAVIQGNIRILKRKIQAHPPPLVRGELFESLEKNLNRLSTIQQETDQIIRSHEKIEKSPRFEELDVPPSISPETVHLYSFVGRLLENIKSQTHHREVEINLDGARDLSLIMKSEILEEIMGGLLKNAIENTPDEGVIRIVLEQKGQWLLLKVMDFGIGITGENQRHLFDGLFHTLDTELYTSKKPYDFGAGGKGLDLLRIKTYGQRFGFEISVGSQRCIYLPTDRDLCPGRISECPHCKTRDDCLNSGGSTFCVSFPTSGGGFLERVSFQEKH